MFWVSGMLRPGRPGVRGPMPYFFGEPRQVPGCLLDSQKSRWRSGTQNIPSLGRWQNGMMIIDHHKWSTFIENNGMINHHLFLIFFCIILWSKSDHLWSINCKSRIICMTFQWCFNDHHPTFSGDGHGWPWMKSEAISRKSCWSGSDRSCLTTWCQRSGSPEWQRHMVNPKQMIHIWSTYNMIHIQDPYMIHITGLTHQLVHQSPVIWS